MTVRQFPLVLAVVTLASTLSAQMPRTERRRWIDSTTGTGAVARSATLVITGDQIVALLPANSTDWPNSALGTRHSALGARRLVSWTYPQFGAFDDDSSPLSCCRACGAAD